MKDRMTILVRSGRGGDGCISFRREKFIPRGGPDGGDGGRGGHVYIRAKDKVSTLKQIRNNGKYVAAAGMQGTSDRKNGKHGDDVFIDVPAGTFVFSTQSGEILADLLENGDKIQIVAGGTGGRGNCHFATAQNRTPREAEPGLEGSEKEIDLVFCVPAEAALIGYPSSGKSSFLCAVSGARSRIGEYEFTTKDIYLGVAKASIFQNVEIVDMPALVEGSSEGKGIGNDFLTHLFRIKLLVYVLDASCERGDAPSEQLRVLMNEVAAYDEDYAEKDFLVVINKADVAACKMKDEIKKIKKKHGIDNIYEMSVATGAGVEEFLKVIAECVMEDEQ